MTKRAGYSLFEVLIAFVIMTMVLAALIPGQARLLGSAGVQEERLLAHDYALSRITQMGVTEALVPGVFQDSYRNWQINTKVATGQATVSSLETMIITVTISDAKGRTLASVESLQAIE